MADKSLWLLILDAGSTLPRITCFTLLDIISWPTSVLLHAKTSGAIFNVTKLEEGKTERWMKKASHTVRDPRKKWRPINKMN